MAEAQNKLNKQNGKQHLSVWISVKLIVFFWWIDMMISKLIEYESSGLEFYLKQSPH